MIELEVPLGMKLKIIGSYSPTFEGYHWEANSYTITSVPPSLPEMIMIMGDVIGGSLMHQDWKTDDTMGTAFTQWVQRHLTELNAWLFTNTDSGDVKLPGPTPSTTGIVLINRPDTHTHARDVALSHINSHNQPVHENIRHLRLSFV
jgi:hypothetical protein